jgi:hypothetical protein
MKRYGSMSLSVLLCCLCSFYNGAQWELKKNENGIAVYTRAADNSDLKEIRVVNKVKSSLSGVIGLLLDTPNYPNWIYDCSIAKILKQVSKTEVYQYQVTHVPSPFDDRDIITDFKIMQDSKTKIVTTTSTALPNYIASKEGKVRIQHFHSSYKFTKVSRDSVLVEFELFADPGGDVPAWLVNSTIIRGPYNTTLEMVKQLPKYQSVTYSFIKEK